MKTGTNILFVAYGTHNSGGTERVTINMVNWLAYKNYKITLISLVGKHERSFYKIDERVRLLRYNILGKKMSFIRKIMSAPKTLISIRKIIVYENPDTLICFNEKLNILISFSLLFTAIPIILSENFTPGHYKIPLFWEIARELTYRRAKAITVLTPDAINHFSKAIRKKTDSIPNMIIDPGIRKDQNKEMKTVIAIGRLEYVKGFDLLISAFLIVVEKYPDWQLHIWGDGRLKDELQKQIDDLRLSNNVYLMGVSEDIYRELQNSDIFVLSSRLEPFGMVIIEAMSVGIPVISTDCPSGPKNIVRDGIDGILVENNNHIKLADSIIKLISDKKLRFRIGVNALDVINRFSPEKIMGEWLKLISFNNK